MSIHEQLTKLHDDFYQRALEEVYTMQMAMEAGEFVEVRRAFTRSLTYSKVAHDFTLAARNPETIAVRMARGYLGDQFGRSGVLDEIVSEALAKLEEVA